MMNRRFFLSLLPAAVAAPAIARVLPAPPPPAVDGWVIDAQVLDRYIKPALLEFQRQIDAQLLAEIEGIEWRPRMFYVSQLQDPERWT